MEATAEDIRYEVQRIDGTVDSIIRAISLILAETREGRPHPPQTIEYGFWEELYKCVFDWQIEDEGQQKMYDLYERLREIFVEAINNNEIEISRPYTETNDKSKARFGSKLWTLSDMLEILIRSDTAIKDHQFIFGLGDKQKRRRKLLLVLDCAKIVKPISGPELNRIIKTMYQKFGAQYREIDIAEFVRRGYLRQRDGNMYITGNKIGFYAKQVRELFDLK